MPSSSLHSLHFPVLIQKRKLGIESSCSRYSFFVCVQKCCVIFILSAGRYKENCNTSYFFSQRTFLYITSVTLSVLLQYFLFLYRHILFFFAFIPSLLAFSSCLSFPLLCPSAILLFSFSLHLSLLIQSLLYSPVTQRGIILNAPSSFAAFQTG